MGERTGSAAYRIAFAYSAAFAISIGMLGFAVFNAMHAEFMRELDTTITNEAQSIAAEVAGEDPGELPDLIRQREASSSPNRMLYGVFAPGGQRLFGTLDSGRPAPGLSTVAFHDHAEGLDPGRAFALDLPGGRRMAVVADLEPVERSDRTVITIFLSGFAAVLALGALGALVLGNYLRRRLSGMSVSANAIIAGDITRRMAVGPRRDEFDQLAETLNRMLERIEQLLENLRQVSSDVAHDLRTPLARLRNRLETGLANAGPTDPAVPVLADAIARVDQIMGLFEAILRIAEIEGGRLGQRLELFDLSALVEDIAESYAPAIADDDRTLTWSVEPHLSLSGDRDLVAQALVNLVENGQRHTPRGTALRIDLASDGPTITLAVGDNGPGVARADRARITQRFVRLEASRSSAGHGLGLNLVAAVASLHGAELEFSDNGPGLLVSIHFHSGRQEASSSESAH